MNSTKPPSDAQASCAPERRYDPVTGLWYVIASDRQHRPQELPPLTDATIEDASACPFCRGHESQTTPTIVCLSAQPAEPPSTSMLETWQVRVVENLYPCFVAGASDVPSDADVSLAYGRHEVIIESPTHDHRLNQLSASQVTVVLQAYRHRLQWAQQDPAFKYALVFKNSGREAGMSRRHVHSQFVALPEVPPWIERKLTAAARFLASEDRCVFCHLTDQAMDDGERVVLCSESFVVYCPDASRTPYEIRIVPRTHAPRFEASHDGMLAELAEVMGDILNRLDACLPGRAYNYIIHTLPFDTSGVDHYHWHIEIIPRITFLAGLEWGAGVLVNTVPPAVAADRLREAAKN